MSLPAWQEELGAFMRENKNRLQTSPFIELLDLVCTTMDFDYYLVHQEEFNKLPEALVQHMLSLPGCKLRSPKYFHLVVKAGLRCILIPCFAVQGEGFTWTTEDVNKILDLIRETCPPDSLEKFGLVGQPERQHMEDCITHSDYAFDGAETLCPKPDLERVHAILRKQSGLQEVELVMLQFTATSETLSIIGENCHDLRSLSINLYDAAEESCEEIDFDTMRQLSDGCPVLQKLDLNGAGAGMKRGTKRYALQHLRQLVHFPNSCSIRDIVTFVESGGILPPNWQPDVSFVNQNDVNNRSVIQALCPEASSLEIDHENTTEDLMQYQFRSVKRLDLNELEPQNIPQIEPFLRACGADITNITLSGYIDVQPSNVTLDLSVVTEHCQKLEIIEICSVPLSNTCEYSVTPAKVKFLRCLRVDIPLINKEHTACTPPSEFLYPVVCNGVLEHLDLSTMSPPLLERMTEEMRTAAVNSKPSPVFPKLNLLKVDRIGQGGMTLRQAVDLVSLAPRLTSVKFKCLGASNKGELRKFLDKFVEDCKLI